jgi:hypothetical protein
MNPVQRALNNVIAQEKQAFLVDIGSYMQFFSIYSMTFRHFDR